MMQGMVKQLMEDVEYGKKKYIYEEEYGNNSYGKMQNMVKQLMEDVEIGKNSTCKMLKSVKSVNTMYMHYLYTISTDVLPILQLPVYLTLLLDNLIST